MYTNQNLSLEILLFLHYIVPRLNMRKMLFLLKELFQLNKPKELYPLCYNSFEHQTNILQPNVTIHFIGSSLPDL